MAMSLSRATVGAIVLAAVAVLLAVGLFVAGAMWRARVTGVAGPRADRIAGMAITGRWPRAIFYDSKTTLFNWAGSWRGAAAQLLKQHGAQVSEPEFVETWVR